jgi:hypothetical protein
MTNVTFTFRIVVKFVTFDLQDTFNINCVVTFVTVSLHNLTSLAPKVPYNVDLVCTFTE